MVEVAIVVQVDICYSPSIYRGKGKVALNLIADSLHRFMVSIRLAQVRRRASTRISPPQGDAVVRFTSTLSSCAKHGGEGSLFFLPLFAAGDRIFSETKEVE